MGKGVVGLGKMGEGEWEKQASKYGMNKLWERESQYKEYDVMGQIVATLVLSTV